MTCILYVSIYVKPSVCRGTTGFLLEGVPGIHADLLSLDARCGGMGR